MAQYLIIYSTGTSVADGEMYFFQTRKKKEYLDSLKEIKKMKYTVLHKSHDERRIKL